MIFCGLNTITELTDNTTSRLAQVESWNATTALAADNNYTNSHT